MPWQSGSGGGGPWGGGSGGSGGSGGGGPWGGGGGGQRPGGGGGGFGGQRPPDFEDMIRKGQDRLKSMFPGSGGKGPSRSIIMIIIAVLVIGWLATGLYRVQPGQQGVVLTFGEWTNQTNLAAEGLHWHLPYPIERALTPNVEEVRQIEIGFRGTGTGKRDVSEEALMLTGDQNIIDIQFTVQWRIKNAGQYLFNIRNPDETIKIAAESAMREIIGRTDIQPALTEAKEQIATDARDLLQSILDDYVSGIEINQINMEDVQPPAPVEDAFEEVQRARQDLDRLRNEAEAYRNKVIPEARGQAQRMRQEAEAYKERLVNEAEGEANRFLSVYEAYKQNPEVTRRRMYLETIQKIYTGTDKIILDDNVGGTVPYLPLDQLRNRSSSGPSASSGAGQ
jgi:membrane protease subunit HflK